MFIVDKNEYERVKGFSRTFKEFLQIEKDYCKNLKTLISVCIYNFYLLYQFGNC